MVFDFEDVNDPGKLLRLAAEAVAFGPDSGQILLLLLAQFPLFVRERLRRTLLGFDQRIEEVLEAGVLVGKFVPPQAGLFRQ
ncbi:hypothetical protein ACFCXH_29655 [Streptomyces nojiriensis]|uniref:hypothetical protein n=1 Tax=Streptomyces nojiriensis TaxID=66374 RepID=UPI0035E12DEC